MTTDIPQFPEEDDLNADLPNSKDRVERILLDDLDLDPKVSKGLKSVELTQRGSLHVDMNERGIRIITDITLRWRQFFILVLLIALALNGGQTLIDLLQQLITHLR